MEIKKRTADIIAQKKQASRARIAKARTVIPPVPERFKKQSLQSKTEESLAQVPKITNETIAEHRETVLKGARKYKYPLERSKHAIVRVTVGLLAAAIVGFLVATLLNLYKFQSTSEFTYRVTQVLPFPVAKAGSNFVSYESYLFEMRRYMHYYETQQKVDFASESGKLQLAAYKPQALTRVINEAYIKQLAKKNGVTVSNTEVTAAVDRLRIQNQLGGDDKELAAVTQKFFNWSLDDLKRRLRDELLAQKVAAKLDVTSLNWAQEVAKQVKSGADFAALAAQYSEDQATKASGGQYADEALKDNGTGVFPQVYAELKRLKPGEVSGVITTPTSFEVVKLISADNGVLKAAHIELKIKDISTFIAPLEKDRPSKRFIRVNTVPEAPVK